MAGGFWTRRRAAFVTSCAILALAAPAFAQDSEEDGEDSRLGGTIVVTAERRATDLQETPLSIVAEWIWYRRSQEPRCSRVSAQHGRASSSRSSAPR